MLEITITSHRIVSNLLDDKIFHLKWANPIFFDDRQSCEKSKSIFFRLVHHFALDGMVKADITS